MVKIETLNKLKCLRCNYTWVPRKTEVIVCPNPKCHSAYWNIPKTSSEEYRRKVSRQDFEKWKFHIGCETYSNVIITEDNLRKWADDINRKLECIFCGSELVSDATYCRRCKEYKGLQPMIQE